MTIKQCRCGGAQIDVADDHQGPVHCGELGCHVNEDAERKKRGCILLGRMMGEHLYNELRRPSPFARSEQVRLKV